MSSQVGRYHITRTRDCGENKGGWFCQVYSDEAHNNEIDNFCIHPSDTNCRDEVLTEDFAIRYVLRHLQEYDKLMEKGDQNGHNK